MPNDTCVLFFLCCLCNLLVDMRTFKFHSCTHLSSATWNVLIIRRVRRQIFIDIRQDFISVFKTGEDSRLAPKCLSQFFVLLVCEMRETSKTFLPRIFIQSHTNTFMENRKCIMKLLLEIKINNDSWKIFQSAQVNALVQGQIYFYSCRHSRRFF